jgi:hypothetical protein
MSKIKEDEIGRTCNKLGRNEKLGLQSGNLKERDNFGKPK